MKKIYLIIMVILMLFLVGCQESVKKIPIIKVDKISLSSDKEEIIYQITINNQNLINSKNKIKQLNYYYAFDKFTKEDLIQKERNQIVGNTYNASILFTEENYSDYLSIIFEMELEKDGYIYSTVNTINIYEFAKTEYEKDKSNLIARKICNPGDLMINFSNIKLSLDKDEVIIDVNFINESLITEVNYIKQFNYYYSFNQGSKEQLLSQQKNIINNKKMTHIISFDEDLYKSDLSIIFEIELALDGLIYSDIKTINIYKLAKEEYLKDNNHETAKKIYEASQVYIDIDNISLSPDKEEIIYDIIIDNNQWITDENYIKQFNYYYTFSEATKEELLNQNKNIIENNELSHNISFTESNYKNNISIIFEIELAQDSFVYSEVKTINITDLARSEYQNDETNLIARKILGLGEIKIDISNISLSTINDEVVYEFSILNNALITEKNYIKQFNYYYSFDITNKETLLNTTKHQIDKNESTILISFNNSQYKNDISIIFEIELALDGIIYSKVDIINIYELAKEEYLKNPNHMIAKKICDQGEVIITCTNVSLSSEKEEIIYDIKIGFDKWITTENYIKQFNYYYSFDVSSKEELLKQKKNTINNKELTHCVSFTEEQYTSNLSVIFVMELAEDGFIYSPVKTINITEFAKSEYKKNEANLIARKIIGLGEVSIDISNIKLSSKAEEIIYEISLLNDILITENNYIKQFNYYYSFNASTMEELLKSNKVEIKNNGLINNIIFDELNYYSDLSIIFEIELGIDGLIYSDIKTINIQEFARSEYQRNEANLIARKIIGLGEVEFSFDKVTLSNEKEELLYYVSILNDVLITEKNYIKQFNYYYIFASATKEELLLQNKNVITNQDSSYAISFSRSNYENNVSIIFEIELALDGLIYSDIKTINIIECARDTYIKDKNNLIAKNICEYNKNSIIIIDLKLDLNKTKANGETDFYSYTYSNPSYNKITVKITLKEGYSFSNYFVLVLNDEVVKSEKYTIEGNVITYIFKDPNWSIIV